MQTENPLETQIGGSHYSKLVLQPTEFSMANGWDCCAHAILQYLSRHRNKGGRLDVEKAAHFVALRAVLVQEYSKPRRRRYRIIEYCDLNGIEGDERLALYMLEKWLLSPEKVPGMAEALITIIDRIKLSYPQTVDV